MIRQACDSDGGAIYRLAMGMIAESPNYARASVDSYRLNAMIDKLTKLGTLLVSTTDGQPEVVAFMAYLVAPHWLTGEPEACDVALYVAPAWRGQGLAEKLVVAALVAAERRDCVAFVAGTSTGTNDDAVSAVYARVGFISTGRTYRKALVPAGAPA